MRANNYSNMDYILESNIDFFKEFAQKHPEFYERPLIEEKDGEKFLETLHEEYRQHNEWQDPLEKITLNVVEDVFLAPEQNVIIYSLPPYIPAIMHYNEFFDLKYVCSGKCVYFTKDKKIVLKEGDIIITPPRIQQGFLVEEKDVVFNILIRSSTFNTAFFQLINHEEFLAEFFSSALYGSPSDYILWNCSKNQLIKNLIIRCYDEFYSEKPYNNRMVEILTMELFVELLRVETAIAPLPDTASLNAQTTIKALVHYLQKKDMKVSLSDAALICNYSERQLSRILKEEMGCSFTQLRLRLRLERACSLLQQQSLELKKIAIATGFENSSYFCKVFRNAYGVTPMEYRERMLKDRS